MSLQAAGLNKTDLNATGIKLERIVRQNMLYDFYGELLTEHQREAYEAVVMEDLSYAELARLEGISRQGAYDMIRRCDKQLEEYEEKLHLVERFLNMKDELKQIEAIALQLKDQIKDQVTSKADPSDKIEEILNHSRNLLRDL